MVVQAEQDRVKHLLTEALPMLCRSGLSFSSEFSVEALIGITLDKSDVFLVSVKETVTSDGGGDVQRQTSVDVNVTKVLEGNGEERGESTRKKRHRKRRRSKSSGASESESDDSGNDKEENDKIKREKMSTQGSDSEHDDKDTDFSTENAHVHYEDDSNERVIVKQEPSASDFPQIEFGSGANFDMSDYTEQTGDNTTQAFTSGSVRLPQSATVPGAPYAHAVQVMPSASQQTVEGQPPSAQASVDIKSEPYNDQALFTSTQLASFAELSQSQNPDTRPLELGRNILLDLISDPSLDRQQCNNRDEAAEVNHASSFQDGSSQDRLSAMQDISKCVVQISPADWMCVLCQQHFTRSYTLQTHIRVVHWKERPYKCSNCPAKFGKKSNMTAHERLCKRKWGQYQKWLTKKKD